MLNRNEMDQKGGRKGEGNISQTKRGKILLRRRCRFGHNSHGFDTNEDNYPFLYTMNHSHSRFCSLIEENGGQ